MYAAAAETKANGKALCDAFAAADGLLTDGEFTRMLSIISPATLPQSARAIHWSSCGPSAFVTYTFIWCGKLILTCRTSPGDYGLATYPWDLANKSSAAPKFQKTALVEVPPAN